MQPPPPFLACVMPQLAGALQLLADASGERTSALPLCLLPPGAGQPQYGAGPTVGLAAGEASGAGAAPQASTSNPGDAPSASHVHDAAAAAGGAAADVVELQRHQAADPLERLMAGEVRCVEFAGGEVVVDAPRSGRVYLPGSFNPLHNGGWVATCAHASMVRAQSWCLHCFTIRVGSFAAVAMGSCTAGMAHLPGNEPMATTAASGCHCQ